MKFRGEKRFLHALCLWLCGNGKEGSGFHEGATSTYFSFLSCFATCGICLEFMYLLLYFQVALRIRPVSMAELEEGATLIAHKVDDQVLWKA